MSDYKNPKINYMWSVEQGKDTISEKRFEADEGIMHVHSVNGIITEANIRTKGDSNGTRISSYEASMLDLLPGETKVIKGENPTW